jgi:hypothetical protein
MHVSDFFQTAAKIPLRVKALVRKLFRKATNMKEVLAALNGFKNGQIVNLKYFQPGQGFQTATATLIERPALPRRSSTVNLLRG